MQQGQPLALQGQTELLHRLTHAFQLGLGLALLQVRDIAHAHLVVGQTQRILTRFDGGTRQRQLSLQRAQTQISLRRGGGYGQRHGITVSRRGLGAQVSRLAQVLNAAPQVQLPAGLQARLQ